MMGEMHVLDKSGDTKVIWDSKVPVEVGAAHATFDDLKGRGYLAYSVKKSGERKKVITEFDPAAEKLIMAPMMKGG